MIRAALLTLVFVSQAFGSATVTLRDSAALPGPAVLLGEIADIEGDGADELRETVVLEALPGDGLVRLDVVRDALDEAGVNWGRVALRGGACRVRLGEIRIAPVRQEMTCDEPMFDVIELAGPETPRTRIARYLAELYDVSNEALRIRFDAADERFLDEIPAGMRFDVTVGSGSASERAPVQVLVFDGDRVHATRTVRADVRVRRRVLQLTRTVDRGERFDAKALNAMERWVSPGGSPVVSEMDGALGQLARTRLGAGTVVRQAHLDLPVLIRRNDLATVHCLSGSVSLRVQARAQEDGREGDVIEFRKGRRGEPFRARVSGAGFAVATDETEATR